jgi:Flp pilus assembly protein TadD
MSHRLEPAYLAAAEQGDLATARRILGEILAEQTTSATYLNDMAVLYFLDGQLALARVHLLCAIIFEPDHALAHENLQQVTDAIAAASGTAPVA